MRLDGFLSHEFIEQSKATPLSRVEFRTPERQKEFFRKAKCNNRTWKDFYLELVARYRMPVTFRRFKRWYQGKALPTAGIVSAVCDVTGGQELTMLDISFRDENWGQRKGGYRKVAIRGCNLTISDRIKGGKTAGNSNSVEHLKRIASLGGVGLIRSGKSPSRKTLGPNGVKMYDYLERDIFRGLLSAGMPAEYEPVIKADSRRIIPDFRVGDVYIECTRDNKVNVKAQKLVERFRLLEKRVPFSKGIVVTLPRLLVRYRQLIPSDIEVVTTQGFLANASHIDRPSPERLLLDPRPDDSPRQPLINA